MPKKNQIVGQRHITIEYFADRAERKLVKRCRARYADRAIASALRHLLTAAYPKARYCSIHDEARGKPIGRFAPTIAGFIFVKLS